MFVLILMLRNPHFFILIFLLIVKRKYAKKSISRLIVILGIYRVNE
ncbi:Flagellin [Bacillus cereus AH676]|nr:Flagellin [Bacillus cereus AH676]